MRIIKIDSNSNGSHNNQTGNFPVVKEGWAVIPDGMAIPDTLPFVNITAENGVVTSMTAVVVPKPESALLDDVKSAKVSASKTALADYLAFHPLTWTDGQVYSVTEEKQGLLTSQLALAQVAAAASQPYTLRWNASGGVRTEWTLSNLSALALAIGAYVQPLVSQQQTYEVAVNACETVSAVEEVPLDYGAAEGGNDA